MADDRIERLVQTATRTETKVDHVAEGLKAHRDEVREANKILHDRITNHEDKNAASHDKHDRRISALEKSRVEDDAITKTKEAVGKFTLAGLGGAVVLVGQWFLHKIGVN